MFPSCKESSMIRTLLRGTRWVAIWRSCAGYHRTVGHRLVERYGDHWATVDAGRGFIIGLHPPSPKYPAPGTKGAMMLGLEVNSPIETVVQQLKDKGIRFSGDIIRDQGGAFANFEDP